MDGMTLDQMRAFATVAQAGSFRAGAQRLHRVQSAVSHAIAGLEAQLGVALFDRSRYRPVLTPAGQALLADVRAVLARVDAVKAHARELVQGVEPRLSLAVDTLFPPARVADALRRMRARHPGVVVRIEYTSMGGTLEALLTRRCTAAIAATEEFDARIAFSFVTALSGLVVAAPGHPLATLARRRSAKLEQAFGEHLQIVVEDPSRLTEGRDFGVLSPDTWRTGDMHSKLALLRAGVGWGSLPAWMVEDDLAAGRLVRLPTHRLGRRGETGYQAYFCHRADEALGVAAACVRDALGEPAA